MNRYLRTARVLWFALLMASLIYPAMLVFMLANGRESPEPNPLFPPIFYAMALIAASLSFALPRLGLAQALAPFASRVGSETSGSEQPPWPGYRAPVASERVVRLRDADLRRLMRVMQTRLILALALSEVASIDGFMMGFLGQPTAVWVPLSAAGTLLIALRFPTQRWALGAVERAHGARAVVEGS